MKKYSCFFLLAAFVLLSLTASGNIRLPALVSSGMVLQQNSILSIWGWCEPGEKIYITTSWNGITDSTVGTNGAKWKVSIKTPAAGGPFTITLKGYNTILLDNILVGEVWVCSGQSNMEWSSYHNLKQIIEELPTSSNNFIRLFHIPKTTATAPQENLPGEWKVCSPESLKGFSAIGYFFGKKLQHELGVPVGLINASWSGTAAEVWAPSETVISDDGLIAAARVLNESKWWPKEPGIVYNAMISPLTSFAIAGAIWYQGESNTGTAATYQKLFTGMIGAWRKAWKKDIPFYYVQIAPYAYETKYIGALLREQQTRSLSYPNTGMVVTTDLVDNVMDIHPANKRDVALRLANWALARTYNRDIGAYQSPSFKDMDIERNKAILYFNHAPNGFITKNGNATEFYIAGDDRIFLPADVRIEQDRIIISNKQIKKPAAVRFGFSNTAMPNLFSKEGLPVTPFRTDNWEVDK